MKISKDVYFIVIFLYIGIFAASASDILIKHQTNNLRLELDNNGHIICLEDIVHKVNYISPSKDSYLLTCQIYNEQNRDGEVMPPLSAEVLKRGNGKSVICLRYEKEIEITVSLAEKSDYIRMEIINVAPKGIVSQVNWGPYHTTMMGLTAHWLGMTRSDNFTIGLMGLEPNTDADSHMTEVASYTNDGSSLHLVSRDYTRDRFYHGHNNNETLRHAEPLHNVTVKGSAVALYGSNSGKDNELAQIEKIELAEHLPHPMFHGEWNKRTKEGQKFCLWGYYTEDTFEDFLEIASQMKARIICRPNGFFANWGHFDIDKSSYPSGIEAVKRDGEKAKTKGLTTTVYTLTSFLKPMNEREPYIAPIPDHRLQTWKVQAVLAKDFNKDDTVMTFQKSDELIATLNAAANKVVRVDNEIIEFKSFTEDGTHIVTDKCQRGTFHTAITNHTKQSKAILMYVSGYHNFYPGTLNLSNEVSTTLAKRTLQTGAENFVVDGFESCLELGYGCYGGNTFLKNYYDICRKAKHETLITGSNITQYTWHMLSHMSWGEWDLKRGMRGSMLDYRICRQIQLGKNLIPKKMGQYYPDNASVEDIEWAMGISTGWNSGVDFQLDLNKFAKNPNRKRIIEQSALWTDARDEKIFTKEQKMLLRQADVEYSLKKESDGKWHLMFGKFWQSPNFKQLSSSVFNLRPISGGKETIAPCSISWFWTHNPGTCDEVILSDDLIHTKGTTPSQWKMTCEGQHFQFVARVPCNAPSGVKNIKVQFGDQLIEIPMVLQPGEYLAIPFSVPWICVYNSEHKVIADKLIRGQIPVMKKGAEETVSVSCEPLNGGQSKLLINISSRNGYFYQNY